jgi:hypothetical protein
MWLNEGSNTLVLRTSHVSEREISLTVRARSKQSPELFESLCRFDMINDGGCGGICGGEMRDYEEALRGCLTTQLRKKNWKVFLRRKFMCFTYGVLHDQS